MKYYKLEFFVPENHSEAVKNAIFAAGAGKYGNYDRCCWQTPGTGQFRPLQGSSPYYGELGKIEYTDELKIETICSCDKLGDVLSALLKTHPYEIPAHHYWEIQLNSQEN
ncbi:NGG1p interacting factor NIF3 [Lentisphaerota bacterium ZTH]|nr:NGG1p interacting factor NIF3 [Lentisphaerota bacterium]WET05422.1 NGG1p interacting factor NIF3 [Lentisphaerota bacterium ZTH]